MSNYLKAIAEELKDWKKAVMVIVFTIARIIYGWSWFESGLHKLSWFSDGKLNSVGKIGTMVNNLAGPEVKSFDPLYINKLFAWLGENIFAGALPGLTDGLVVIFEIAVGAVLILGIGAFWAGLIATFLNLQFMAGGSFNNFGYIWTNLAVMKFARYTEAVGIGGFLRFKKGKDLL